MFSIRSAAASRRRRRRAEAIDDCQKRLGLPVKSLEAFTLVELQKLHNRHEILIEAEAARQMIDPREAPRVLEFIASAPTVRSLLDGRASAAAFVECFVVWSGASGLLRHGRTLKHVVERIADLGGMAAAAEAVPWLQQAVPLSKNFSFAQMEAHRIFVRHASTTEALSAPASCSSTQRMYIEEGQHRAIAAAWVLTSDGSDSAFQRPHHRERSITYLRGVNRRGAEAGDPFSGEGFWRLNETVDPALRRRSRLPPPESERYPTAELLSAALCVLLTLGTCHEPLRRLRRAVNASPEDCLSKRVRACAQQRKARH